MNKIINFENSELKDSEVVHHPPISISDHSPFQLFVGLSVHIRLDLFMAQRSVFLKLN